MFLSPTATSRKPSGILPSYSLQIPLIFTGPKRSMKRFLLISFKMNDDYKKNFFKSLIWLDIWLTEYSTHITYSFTLYVYLLSIRQSDWKQCISIDMFIVKRYKYEQCRRTYKENKHGSKSIIKYFVWFSNKNQRNHRRLQDPERRTRNKYRSPDRQISIPNKLGI